MNEVRVNPSRGRGKGKTPAKAHVNLRVPEEVLEFYRRYPSYTAKMREVLIQYKEQVEAQDPQT
jgi:uncharacterized protein (DUF4415 family)